MVNPFSPLLIAIQPLTVGKSQMPILVYQLVARMDKNFLNYSKTLVTLISIERTMDK